MKMLSPPQPQNTDTHTKTFFACRKTQYEANKPIQYTPQSIKRIGYLQTRRLEIRFIVNQDTN